jgi:hypothetical protein
VGRAVLTVLQARVAHASGTLPYLCRAQRKQFLEAIYFDMLKVGYNWRSYPHHGALLRTLLEVGGLRAIPDDHVDKSLSGLCLPT